eukprot:scaffold33729_cov19-Tisochrysis_lutea.AAC.2
MDTMASGCRQEHHGDKHMMPSLKSGAQAADEEAADSLSRRQSTSMHAHAHLQLQGSREGSLRQNSILHKGTPSVPGCATPFWLDFDGSTLF